MSVVGLIANPAAGRDIRRLVGLASVVPNHEKAAIVRRVLAGLAATGVDEVRYLADAAGIVVTALDGSSGIRALPIQMAVDGTAEDSRRAAALLVELGASPIITLGGDGTNRAVAAGCEDIPLVCISTGTNNVFPTMIDGTVAGIAAGLVATGRVDTAATCTRSKVVRVASGTRRDFALVDAAACSDRFVGARAIWDPSRVRALVFARTEPWAVGLSAVGGQLLPIGATEPAGLYVEIGQGTCVHAVLAPGVVVEVPVSSYRSLALDEVVELPPAGTIALDGERELAVDAPARAWVEASGPRVVDIRAVMTHASRRDA